MKRLYMLILIINVSVIKTIAEDMVISTGGIKGEIHLFNNGNLNGTLSLHDTPGTEEKDIIIKDLHKEDSLLNNVEIPFWQLDFSVAGSKNETDTLLFQFEIFINHNLTEQISGNPASINEALYRYKDKIGNKDILKLILVNQNYTLINVQTEYRSYSTNDQEVFFYFHPGHSTNYSIELFRKSPEIVDFSFFYIEKSNGIENLRDVRDRLEPLINEQKSFLAYFHGPENRAIIISHKSGQDQINEFFNILFTSRTQPPFVPNDELLNVQRVLSQYIPKNNHQVNLKMYMYFNEASYSFLLDPFLTPLLESRIHEFNLMDWHAFILTDFDVTSKNDKHTYINLVNP